MHTLRSLLLICLLKAELLVAQPVAPTCSAWVEGDSADASCSSWLQRTGSNVKAHEEDKLFARYVATCRDYGLQPSADVLNRLQVHSGRLAIKPVGHARCGDLDVRALVLLLLDGDGMLLSDLKILDLSDCDLGIASALLIARLLQHPKCCIEQLDLSNAVVSSEGACAIAAAIPLNPSKGPKSLRMKESWLYDDGAQIMLRLLKNSSAHRLEELDLQNNFISFRLCAELKVAADASGVTLKLAGNRVLDEILNAVTHGVGEVLVIIGCVVLSRAIQHKAPHVRKAVIVYMVSLNVLYMASTLYLSFFALGHKTVEIFHTLDYSGIFILIAGSYTPFLGILFHGQCWASVMLGGIWATGIAGIITAAFYHGEYQVAVRLTLFIGMGWTALSCLHKIVAALGWRGGLLLFGGGVLYTAGVPWEVRNGHTFGFPDHSIWHIFVIAASVCHYLCILWYVVERRSPDGDEVPKKSVEGQKVGADGELSRIQVIQDGVAGHVLLEDSGDDSEEDIDYEEHATTRKCSIS